VLPSKVGTYLSKKCLSFLKNAPEKTLAYLSGVLITKKKIITLKPDIIEFYFICHGAANKLQCMSLASLNRDKLSSLFCPTVCESEKY
jgi:hypothetical protein